MQVNSVDETTVRRNLDCHRPVSKFETERVISKNNGTKIVIYGKTVFVGSGVLCGVLISRTVQIPP